MITNQPIKYPCSSHLRFEITELLLVDQPVLKCCNQDCHKLCSFIPCADLPPDKCLKKLWLKQSGLTSFVFVFVLFFCLTESEMFKGLIVRIYFPAFKTPLIVCCRCVGGRDGKLYACCACSCECALVFHLRHE